VGQLEYCEDCKRAIGIGCACGMTFLEKLRTVQIDKESLK